MPQNSRFTSVDATARVRLDGAAATRVVVVVPRRQLRVDRVARWRHDHSGVPCDEGHCTREGEHGHGFVVSGAWRFSEDEDGSNMRAVSRLSPSAL
jgi:hypothetical protein